MRDEPQIAKVLGQSVLTKSRFFVLSALTKSDLSQVMEIRDAIWSIQKKPYQDISDIASISLCFPWSEHPAHALFTSAIEHWEPFDLERMLTMAFSEHGEQAATANPHLAAVLSGLANPSSLATAEFYNQHRFADSGNILRPLIRAYVLDPTSYAPDRRKLGLTRPLTTQNRYELLASIWRCQQGLTDNLTLQKHTRLWIMLDEVEHMLDYAPVEKKLLIQGLITLLMELQSHFTLWLNISEADSDCINEVKRTCGTRLWEYLTFDLTSDGQSPTTLSM